MVRSLDPSRERPACCTGDDIGPLVGVGGRRLRAWIYVFGIELPRDLICTAMSWLPVVRFAFSPRALSFTAPLLALPLLLLLPVVGLVYHIYFDRRGLPDLEPFIRF